MIHKHIAHMQIWMSEKPDNNKKEGIYSVERTICFSRFLLFLWCYMVSMMVTHGEPELEISRKQQTNRQHFALFRVPEGECSHITATHPTLAHTVL